MKKFVNLSMGLIVLVVMAGCTSLTQGGEKVRILRNPAEVADCQEKGKLRTEAWIGDPKIEARNIAAADFKADTILIEDASDDDNTIAIAYVCQ